MTETQVKEDILKDLEPLFVEAIDKGLWFHCFYQDLWFSPKELREHQARGSFIWGKCNWELRNPEELINQLIKKRDIITDEIEETSLRITKNR